MSDKSSIFSEPSKVAAVDGLVELDGPDDVDIAMTPEAAEETADRLTGELMKAHGQRRLKDMPHQPGR